MALGASILGKIWDNAGKKMWIMYTRIGALLEWAARLNRAGRARSALGGGKKRALWNFLKDRREIGY